jgi:Cu/Ag efflux protein CusF
MKRIFSIFILAFSIAFIAPAQAADPQQLPLVDAIVRKVDAANARVMLSHGAIPNLDMPGMTMTFRVQDAAWLQGLAPAAKVKVAIDEIGGEMVVVRLERAAK